jgi:hypothetical protein
MLLSQITSQYPILFLNNPDGTGAATGEWTIGRRTATLSFLCYWSDLEGFLQQIAGYPIEYGVGHGASIVQQVPLIYPFNSKLYAQRISHRAATCSNILTPITLANPYSKAMVTVEFGTFPFQISDGSTPWLNIQSKGSTEFVTIPGVPFTFSDGSKPEKDLGKIMGMQTFTIQRFQIPSFDQWLQSSYSLMGQVNSDTVTISQTPIAPGYLFFPTQDISSQTNVLGSPQSTATIQLVYRSKPWNQAMRADGTWDTLTPNVYDTTALSGLLQ